jgi:hypothetical protein
MPHHIITVEKKKSSLKLALPLPKNISLPVVTLDANVAVPFNVPSTTT